MLFCKLGVLQKAISLVTSYSCMLQEKSFPATLQVFKIICLKFYKTLHVVFFHTNLRSKLEEITHYSDMKVFILHEKPKQKYCKNQTCPRGTHTRSRSPFTTLVAGSCRAVFFRFL